jgi:hypothetical protein
LKTLEVFLNQEVMQPWNIWDSVQDKGYEWWLFNWVGFLEFYKDATQRQKNCKKKDMESTMLNEDRLSSSSGSA